MKIGFGLANSADSDAMLHYGAFHLCLHIGTVCQSTLLGLSDTQMVNSTPLGELKVRFSSIHELPKNEKKVIKQNLFLNINVH